MHRTIIIRRDYLHYVPKYNRYEKRHKNVAAHVSPAFRVEEGDVVTVGQCRPISKTVRFNVLKVSAGASRSRNSLNSKQNPKKIKENNLIQSTPQQQEKQNICL